MSTRVVYRFTRDLRLEDHAGLARAAADGDVVPVLVLDRLLEARIARSPRRAAFFCSSVAALDAALRERDRGWATVRVALPRKFLRCNARWCPGSRLDRALLQQTCGMPERPKEILRLLENGAPSEGMSQARRLWLSVGRMLDEAPCVGQR